MKNGKRSSQTETNNKSKVAKEVNQIIECRKILKENILQPSTLIGFADKRTDVLKIIQRTVSDTESNSALLIGPPGSGKSTLVRTVLEELSKEKTFVQKAVVVQLNGLIHTDDRLALIAISKQMNLENVVDDRVTGNFADNMLLLLDTLKSKGQVRAVVFILEEMDLFCSHHNQTLLYNLFDIAHSNKASVCVLGVTCRLDVLDLMEKRVKSRFSHRHIHLLPRGDAEGLKERIELCTKLLTLENKEVAVNFAAKWNKHIHELFQSSGAAYLTIKKLFNVDSREQATKDFLLQVICCLDIDHPKLLPGDFNSTFEDIFTDNRSRMIHGLSVLELCLVIAMKQLGQIYHGEPVNFEMVYSRYLKYARTSSTEACPREVVLKAFEHLQALEVLLPVIAGVTGSRIQREYQLHHFQLTKLQVQDVVKQYEELPEEIKQWSEAGDMV